MSQASKNAVIATVSTAVALGLAAYAYFGVMKGEEKEQEQKAIDDRVFQAAATAKKGADGGTADISFTRLEVKAKGDHTMLEKRDGQWWLTGAFNAPADKFAVDGITSQLQTAKFKTRLSEKPTEEELKKYGLQSPKFSVSAVAKMPDGSERKLQLVGGIDNPFDGSVYMRRDADVAVYTAEGGLRWTLEKSMFDLRDKEVFSFEESKVQKLRVKAPKGEYTLERDEKNAWKLTSPIQTGADGAVILSMFASLKGERAVAFLPDSLVNRTRTGVEKPDIDAVFTVKTDTGTEDVRVRIARAAPDAGSLTHGLVERTASGVFAEVSANAPVALDKSVDELKDKALLKFDANAVAKLSVSAGGGAPAVVLERTRAEDGGMSEGWQVVSPEKGPAKQFKVAAFLYSLSSTKAAAFGAENPKDWKKFGVDEKTSLWVKAEDAAGQPLVTFIRGSEVPDRPGLVYVRGNKNQVAEIDAAKFAEMPVTAAEFLNLAVAVDAGTAAGP